MKNKENTSIESFTMESQGSIQKQIDKINNMMYFLLIILLVMVAGIIINLQIAIWESRQSAYVNMQSQIQK